jgi:hypothetical protein
MTVRLTKDSMTASLARIQRDLATVPKEIFEYWRSITPIKSGNARRKTVLKGNTINAAYPYAVPLNDGLSKQAPRGMSKPTEEYLERILDKKIRK